ncbi:MAG: DUF5666 domain-containing protein [Betaproteobacteria bacterium]|nr:DUF5666 domain-containing protein [Betaproteobacteria bacterium]
MRKTNLSNHEAQRVKITVEGAQRPSRRVHFVALLLGALFGSMARAHPAYGQAFVLSPGPDPVVPRGGESGGIGGTGANPQGGGIGGTGLHSENGGIGGTGRSIVGYGPIQAFGSVFVNGREYEIGSATRVTVNGQAASMSDLHVGDLAQVEGVETTARGGIAREITISYPIAGPIAAVTHDAIDVVGQRIIAAHRAMMAGLQAGQGVMVSAQQRPDGTWVAYRIAPESRPSHFRLEARLTALGAHSLRVSNTRIILQGALPAGLRVGERVAVTGELGAQGFQATHVAPAPLDLGTADTRVELHDYFRSAGQGRWVAADGLTVRGVPPTVHADGSEAVQISGYLSGGGAVQVEHLEIVPPSVPGPHPRLSPTGPDERESKGSDPAPQSAGSPPERENEGSQEAQPAATTADEVGSPGVETHEVEAPEAGPPEVESSGSEAPEVEPPEVEPPEVEPPEGQTPDD